MNEWGKRDRIERRKLRVLANRVRWKTEINFLPGIRSAIRMISRLSSWEVNNGHEKSNTQGKLQRNRMFKKEQQITFGKPEPNYFITNTVQSYFLGSAS